MLKVVWNIFKYVIGIIFSVFRPLKRLICQRRKSSESDGSELTSIGTGGLILETPLAYPQDGEGEIDMESWDMWDIQSQSVPSYKSPQTGVAHSNSQGHKGDAQMNGFSLKTPQGYMSNKKEAQNMQTEPDVNFFQDMTPEVKRQRKILIRKKDSSQSSSSGSLTNRLAVLSDVPFTNSELEAWEEQANAWDTEVASDDLIWQAEEAIKENRRKERIERHVEQQKKKQKKDEMRGTKSGSLLATKIS